MSEPAWFVVHNDGVKCPEWLRTAAVFEGDVFAPAGLAGNEGAVVLCAMYDGVPAMANGKHIYLPTWWLRREYPEIADICAKVEHRILNRA